jgi:hypothetical protein
MNRSSAVAALVIAAASTPALAQGDFTILGPDLFPGSVSGDGSVITGEVSGVGYFLWTEAGGLVPIGGSPGQGAGGQPTIDWDATVVSGTAPNPVTGTTELSRYDIASGQWVNLGGIGGQSGSSVSSGWGLSGDGSVSVGLGWVNAGGAHAIRWTADGGTQDMGSSVPDRSSRANAADFDGDVIVGWQDSQFGFRQGAVWVNGNQFLITQGGQQMGELGCVSADGQWSGGVGVFSNGQQAYLFNPTQGVVNLGHLQPTFDGGTTGLSADGKVAIGFDRPFGPALFGRGFYWTKETGMVDLNSLASSLGIDTQGVTMSLPLGISPDGRTIVGAGLGSGAVGWRLVLPEPACGYVGYGYGGAAANELVLTGEGSPAVNGNVELVATNAFGDTGFLALGFNDGELPLGNLVLRLDALSLIDIYLMAPGPLGATFQATLPNNPALAGAAVFAQAFAVEPTQPGQLAASNGLKVTICP